MAEKMNGIRKIVIPIEIGLVTEVEVPQYLTGADRPLAIRIDLSESNIEIWAWNTPPLVKAPFLMLSDNKSYTFDGITMRRHFGTVFGLFKQRYGIEGNVIHLLSLYRQPEKGE